MIRILSVSSFSVHWLASRMYSIDPAVHLPKRKTIFVIVLNKIFSHSYQLATLMIRDFRRFS